MNATVAIQRDEFKVEIQFYRAFWLAIFVAVAKINIRFVRG
jgi:hypothetical protein